MFLLNVCEHAVPTNIIGYYPGWDEKDPALQPGVGKMLYATMMYGFLWCDVLTVLDSASNCEEDKFIFSLFFIIFVVFVICL